MIFVYAYKYSTTVLVWMGMVGACQNTTGAAEKRASASGKTETAQGDRRSRSPTPSRHFSCVSSETPLGFYIEAKTTPKSTFFFFKSQISRERLNQIEIGWSQKLGTARIYRSMERNFSPPIRFFCYERVNKKKCPKVTTFLTSISRKITDRS